jgi:hypothetical protein
VTISEGEKIKSNLSGKAYRVTSVRNKLVVLDAEDGSDWMITGKDMLGMFFRKFGNQVRGKSSSLAFNLRSTTPESL